jgi:regulator of replication initiation timing
MKAVLFKVIKSKFFWFVFSGIVLLWLIYSNQSILVGKLYKIIDSMIEQRVSGIMMDYKITSERLNEQIDLVNKKVAELEKRNKQLSMEQEKLKEKLEHVNVEVSNLSVIELAKKLKERGYNSVIVCVKDGNVLRCYGVK